MLNYIKVGVALFLAILILAFVPYTQTYETNINASFLDVAKEINNANNWKSWFIPYKTTYQNNSAKYNVTQNYINQTFSINANGQIMDGKFLGPTLLEIKFDNEVGKTYLLKPVFSKNDKSKLFEVTKTSVLNYCWLYLTNKNKNHNFGKNLNNYFNTPLLYYGFKIEKTGVVDTNFYILTETTLKQNTYNTAQQLREKLLAYAKKNNLGAYDFPFLILTPKTNNLVSVTSLLTAKVEKNNYFNKITYLKMPKNGNMLIGYYKGQYGNRNNLYNAMDKYVNKNGLTRVVNTYEKFLDKKLPKHDTSVVNMALHYPIY